VEDGVSKPARQAGEAKPAVICLDIWKTGDPLPQAPRALIDPAKFTRSSMDPNNLKNNGKWKAFEALGYDVRSDAVRQRATQDVTEAKMTQHGRRFQVRTPITGLNGKEGTLVTTWQFDVGSDVPRLIANWLEVHD
jgi:hypothetical protein